MGKDNQPHNRQQNKIDRKNGKKAPYPRILIVCEGTKTEPQYFREIRQFHKLQNANVQVMPSKYGTSPAQVVEYAYDIFMKGDSHKIHKKSFEKVYAVFDRDDHSTYHEALEAAQTINQKLGKAFEFRAIPSVPCFELWLLLHFEDIKNSLHRDAVARRLKTHVPDYTKGKTGLFELTKSNLDEATKRAERLAKLYTEHDGVDPFTAVYELVGLLNGLKKM
jgi:RloB-like protein